MEKIAINNTKVMKHYLKVYYLKKFPSSVYQKIFQRLSQKLSQRLSQRLSQKLSQRLSQV